MAQARSNTERNKLKQEANQAAERFAAAFLPENAVPYPLAETLSSGTDAMRQVMETGADLARFYTTRLGKQVGYMAELATCRSPLQFTVICARAASEAAHDYTDELDRVMAINLNGRLAAEHTAKDA